MQFIAANAPRVNGNMADLYAGTTELQLANLIPAWLLLGLDLIKKIPGAYFECSFLGTELSAGNEQLWSR